MYRGMHTALKGLGLSKAEINVYSTSLKLGPTTIQSIAKHAGILRPQVYKVIRALESHGLAKFSSRPKHSRSFVVESPSTVLEKFRQKQKKDEFTEHGLISAMPDLLAQYHQGAGETKIRIIQGREQFIKIFFETLEEVQGGSFEFWGSAEEFVNYIGWETEKRFIRTRVRQKTRARVLTFDDEYIRRLGKYNKEQKREMRIIKKETGFFVPCIQTYGRKAIIWQPKTHLTVLIEDEYIVGMFRSMFNDAWKNAGE